MRCLFLPAVIVLVSSAQAEEPAAWKSIARETRDLEGWKVHVDKQLIDGPHAEMGATALRVLGFKLYEITRLVPRDRLKKLQEVGIVLDYEYPRLTSMQYHPSIEWLKKNDHDPMLVKRVHIPMARELTGRLVLNEQPMAILHELAHAYHDQVLDFEEPRIKAAWTRFKESGKYEKVAHISGPPRKHYALTNQMEFFAEMTESYFGTNDFFPFVRCELKTELPDVYELLEEIWVKKSNY